MTEHFWHVTDYYYTTLIYNSWQMIYQHLIGHDSTKIQCLKISVNLITSTNEHKKPTCVLQSLTDPWKPISTRIMGNVWLPTPASTVITTDGAVNIHTSPVGTGSPVMSVPITASSPTSVNKWVMTFTGIQIYYCWTTTRNHSLSVRSVRKLSIHYNEL